MGSRSEQSGQRGKWIRTGCLQTDMLKAFECGDMHDCTIRVGCDLKNPKAPYKDFKCHKFVLSLASDFFERMLFGDFKEAAMGPCEPIPIDKIEYPVFECAMRFVYGRVEEFQSIEFAVKVYKLAHEMQIDTLTQHLIEFFKQQTAEDVFFVFDLFCILDNQPEIQKCKEVLLAETATALNSEPWLTLSLESVLEFLRMDGITAVPEVNLVRALVRWGRFQLHQTSGAFDTMKLRAQILSGLKLIRFSALSHIQFAQLCVEELGEVLSAQEKHSIMMAIVMQDWSLMPPEIVVDNCRSRRKEYIVCKFPHTNHARLRSLNSNFTSKLYFKLDKEAKFVGLKSNISNSIDKFDFSFKLRHSTDGGVVGIGSSQENLFSYDDEDYCRIIPIFTLEKEVLYILQISITATVYEKYFNNQRYQITKDGLTVTCMNADGFFITDTLVFENVRCP